MSLFGQAKIRTLQTHHTKVSQMPSMPMLITDKTKAWLEENLAQLELSHTQRAVLSFFQTHFGFLETITFRQFHFPDALSEHYTVARSKIQIDGEPLIMMICLPTSSTKAFVMLSDTEELSLAELTAFCCSQSERNDAITQGFMAELPQMTGINSLNRQNWHGYMITTLQEVLENAFNPVDTVMIEEEQFEACLILLINGAEYKKGKKTGSDKVLTFFKANKRPFFKFKLFHDKTLSAAPAPLKKPPSHHRQQFELQKNRAPFAGGQNLAEAVALRQKPVHTDPMHIKKVKEKLQKRLQNSQKMQPIPIHLVDINTLSTTNAANSTFEIRHQRKQSRRKWLIASLGLFALIGIASISAMALASPPSWLALIASIAFASSLSLGISALLQRKTLNL